MFHRAVHIHQKTYSLNAVFISLVTLQDFIFYYKYKILKKETKKKGKKCEMTGFMAAFIHLLLVKLAFSGNLRLLQLLLMGTENKA